MPKTTPDGPYEPVLATLLKSAASASHPHPTIR